MAGENKVRPKGFRAVCENFWYHYKYHTLVLLFTLAAVSVMVAQCTAKTDYDYTLVVATSSAELAPAQLEALRTELTAYGDDLNGDGKVTVSLVDCTFNEKTSAYQVIMAKKQKLQAVLMNEEKVMLMISDRACFDWINGITEEGFMEDIGLSQEDGRYFPLDGTGLISRVKAACADNLSWPEELRISRRRVSGTLLEKHKNIEDYVEKAETFLDRLIEKNS